jgi:shikimate kinase
VTDDPTAPPSSRGPRVVLVGPMGAGKTTVGALLAQTWQVPLRDTDADVEAATGRTISELFVDEGEAWFREREHEAVVAALTEHAGVLALGGGAVLDPRSREALVGHTVVFLDVGLADATRRVGLGAGRPMLLGGVRSRIKQLLDERLPVYRSVATVEVSTDGKPAEAVADEVRRAVEAAGQERR